MPSWVKAGKDRKIDLTIMTLHLNTSTEEYIDVPKKKHQKHKNVLQVHFDTSFGLDILREIKHIQT